MPRVLHQLRALVPVGGSLHEHAFAFRHRVVLWVIAAHLPALAALGLRAGESGAHLAAELTLIAGLLGVAAAPRPSRPVRVAFATSALVGCSALLVHLTGGLIESHFHFFAVVAFVTLYQSWLPFLLCIAWVALHHGVVGILRPESVYSHAAAVERPALWALIHAGYVLLASLASLGAWRLSELERLRAESVLAASPQPTYGVDQDGRIVFANDALAELVGRSADELLGACDHDLLHGTPASCTICALVVDGQPHHLDQVPISGGGRTFPAELHVRPVLERARLQGAVVTFWDVSERLAHRRELELLALTDSLTGLANRALLRDRLVQAGRSLLRDGGGFALVFIDLDRFKAVNDALGHRAGDELIVAVADRLREAARPRDTVARVGGDEFVVICPGVTDTRTAHRIACRLVDAVGRTTAVEGRDLNVSASAGVRVSTTVGEDPDHLVADADLAMLSAKARGGGQAVLYRPELRGQAGDRLTLGTDLHQALANGEFVLHYQPIWRLDDLQPIGVEALLRWNHPVHGLLYPGSFLELAEETGMMGPIGAWVLHEAIRQLGRWHAELGDAGAHLRVSVNLSVRQLRDATLLDEVREALAAGAVPPGYLCLEITETVLMQEGDRAIDVLDQLRALGVVLAIDDFGTGFSSLALLRRLSVDELKIDRSFVQHLDADEGSQEVVRAVVGLAHALRMSVVAEGVERSAELEAVRVLASDRAQGFGLARPAPADDIGATLRASLRPLAEAPVAAEPAGPLG